MTTAHVICCNDAVMGVHLGDEEAAKGRMEQLARADFDRNHWHWEDEHRRWDNGAKDAYGYYRKRLYWHLHSMEATQ